MYRNLKSEMVRNDISMPYLALHTGMTERTLRNKIGEITDFTWREALAVRQIVNPSASLEWLFESDKDNSTNVSAKEAIGA